MVVLFTSGSTPTLLKTTGSCHLTSSRVCLFIRACTFDKSDNIRLLLQVVNTQG